MEPYAITPQYIDVIEIALTWRGSPSHSVRWPLMTSDSKVPCSRANQWEPVPERVQIVSLLFHVQWPSQTSGFSGSGRATRFSWCGNKAAEGADKGGKEALRVGVVTQREYIPPRKVCLVVRRWWNARLGHAICLLATSLDPTMSASALVAGSGESC